MEMLMFAGAGLFGVFTLITLINLRRVVSTNEVHIVQSSKKTTSYGKDTGNGNTYYQWPAWLPVLGVTKSVFQVSNFDIDLENYEAYDEGRLPFVVDVKAFFRVEDSNVAAQRVSSFQELKEQLTAIVQGAVRTVLASHPLENIMQGRGKFGDDFTGEVKEQLKNWGVATVKNIELMDIRDHQGSKVIQNIMEKKKSFIEMESRTEVAKNKRTAEIAEIEARKEIDLQDQAAKQSVGLRTVENQRQVKLQEQNAMQLIKEQERTTKEKEMAVVQVQQLRTAEIAKQVSIVQAQQQQETAILVAQGQKNTAILSAEAKKDTSVLDAEAQKTTAILVSEGQLESTRRNAEGISLVGQAKADAEKAMQLAPVQAQITLAKEIGENQSYQKYLITIRQVEATQAVGMEQAKALENADVKIISNTGTPSAGLSNVMELFSANGGTQFGAMLEGLAQTETGQALINKFMPAATTKTDSLN